MIKKKWQKFFVLVLFLGFMFPANTGAGPSKNLDMGESFHYKLKWIGLPVGHAWVSVKGKDVLNGKEVYVVETIVRTNRFASIFYRVKDRFVSYIDVERLIPLKLEVSRREGAYKKDATTLFDHEKGVAYFENFLDGSKKQYKISSESLDIISLFYNIRSNKIRLHEKQFYELTFAEDVFQVEGKADKKKRIRLGNGKVKEAFRAKTIAKQDGKLFDEGTGTCYFSSDEHQILVRVVIKAPIFTRITATLVESTLF